MKPTITTDSATISTTEYFVVADSTTASYQTEDADVEFWFDCSNIAAGTEEFYIRVYDKVNGGTATPVWFARPIGTQPTLIKSPRLTLAEGWEASIQKIAGTDRAIAWSIRKFTEGETVVTGSISNNAITAAAIADSAIDAGAIASDAITAAKIATGAITSAKFAAGAIDAAAIATDAIDADALKADAITEIQSGLATAANVSAVETDTQDIQSRLPAALVSGRMDSSVGAMAANVLTAAATAADFGTEVAAAIAAYAHESGRSLLGLWRRMEAFISGKATGLAGSSVVFYRSDGSTACITATQNTSTGARDAATVGGD